MKKKIITVALVLSSVCAMAQQKENRDTDGSILRGPYETNSFWSNWYIGVGGLRKKELSTCPTQHPVQEQYGCPPMSCYQIRLHRY